MNRLAVITISLALGMSIISANAQSMSGLRIGDDISTLSKIGSEPIAKQAMGPHTAIKFELPDGNALSITYRDSSGQIVYLETDWGQKQSGSFSDFHDFRFGETTLAEIRSALGHNGMAFIHGPGPNLTEDGGLVSVNSYELSTGSLVVAFVTKIDKEHLAEFSKMTEEAKLEAFGSASRLDAIILSDRNYLEGIWGKEKLYDDGYRPIEW